MKIFKIILLLTIISCNKEIIYLEQNQFKNEGDYFITEGDYYYDSTIILGANTKIRGDGNVNFFFSCSTGITTDFQGSQTYPIFNDLFLGGLMIQSDLVCDTGDVILIYSDKTMPGTTYNYGELVTVDHISGNFIYIKTPFVDEYLLINSPVAQKRNLLKNIEISGINIYMTGNDNDIGILLRGCRDSYIKNVNIYDAKNIGIYIAESYKCGVSNSYISDNIKNGTGYGVIIGDCSYYVNLEDNTIINSRHNVTFGGNINHGLSRFCNVINNHVEGSLIGSGNAMDTHANCEYILFSNNTVRYGAKGFDNRGSNIIISDNIINGSTIGICSNIGNNIIVRNNQIQDVIHGILISRGNLSYSIIGNEIYSDKVGSIGIYYSFPSDTINSRLGALISNNKIQTRNGIYFKDNIQNVMITSNNITGIDMDSDGITFATSRILNNKNIIIANNLLSQLNYGIEFIGKYNHAVISENIFSNINTVIYANSENHYFTIINNISSNISNFISSPYIGDWIVENNQSK